MQRPSANLLLLAAALPTATGHVSMVYKEGAYPAGIRNANNPTGNGAASVNSPCGGNTNFGANGIGTMTDGLGADGQGKVTLTMRYAAGHNGNFRMAFACGGQGTGAELEAAAATLTDCTATGAAGAYGANGAEAQGQNEMDIECTLPLQGNTAPQQCIMGILDQRDWGGCVDINLLAAGDPAPPSPPPAPFVSNVGEFALRGEAPYKIDTSAGVKPTGTFSCCALSAGSLKIPAYSEGQTTIQANFEGVTATACPSQVPNTLQTPPPNTLTVEVNNAPFVMAVSDNGNKYTGSTGIAGQQFEVVIAGGAMSLTNTYTSTAGTPGQQPIVCDSISELGLALAGSEGGGSSIVGVVVVILIILVIGGAFFIFNRNKKGGKPPPPPGQGKEMYGAASAQAPPPPPPISANPLPPEWQEMKDPNSGVAYYYNATTGESTWYRPGARV